MAMPPAPRPHRPLSDLARIREAFWVIALGLITCCAFFVALGAFAPGT